MGKSFLYISLVFIAQLAVSNVDLEMRQTEVAKQNVKISCLNGEAFKITRGTPITVIKAPFSNETFVENPEENPFCEIGRLQESKSDLESSAHSETKSDEKLKQKKIMVQEFVSNESKVSSRRRAKKVMSHSSEDFNQIAEKMNYAEKCREEFIGSEGFGPWGKYIQEELSRPWYRSLLKNAKAFKNVCPSYKNMSMKERKKLWVFILMSMSHYESSCRSKVSAQGPYGIAQGLLQLHQGSENQYLHWDQERVCRRGDSRRPRESIQCTLSMLNGQIQKHNSIFFEQSYWDVLRNSDDESTHAAKIKAAIQMLPGCEPRSIAKVQSKKRNSSAKVSSLNGKSIKI